MLCQNRGDQEMKKKRRQPGESEPPSFPEPLLDSVDWAGRILYGSEKDRFLSIFEAKERKDVNAVPALLRQILSDDDFGHEAQEALPVILDANPGAAILNEIVPELAKNFYANMNGYFAVWSFARICEANPGAFSERAPALIALSGEVIKEK